MNKYAAIPDAASEEYDSEPASNEDVFYYSWGALHKNRDLHKKVMGCTKSLK